MQKAQADGETKIATVKEEGARNVESAELEGAAKVEETKTKEAKDKAKEDISKAVDLTNMAVGPGIASLPGMGDLIQLHTKVW